MVTLVLIGVLIGLVLGLTGAGGSVFAVPLLILLAGFSMTDAVGLSLGTVAASTIYASVRSGLQQHTILWKPGAILALVGAVSAPLGKWLGWPCSWLCACGSGPSATHKRRAWCALGISLAPADRGCCAILARRGSLNCARAVSVACWQAGLSWVC